MKLWQLLAGLAAAWTALFVVLYLIASANHGGSPAWWYLAILAIVIAGLALSAAGRLSRQALLGATVVLFVATLVALLSVGVLLLPGLVASIVACTPIGDRTVFDSPPPED